MRQQRDGIVSVWIGRFASHTDLADYIRWTHTEESSASAFASHAGIGVYDFGEMEAAFYEAVPVPARQAVAEFPGGGVFATAAAEAITGKSADGWNALVLLYDCSYSADRGNPSSARRRDYVGAIEYRPST